MIDILYIAYQFAPLNTGGSLRPVKFVKYFNEFGIDPTVCTLDPKSYPNVYERYNSDDSLHKDIPSGTDIRYIPSENIHEKQSNRVVRFLEIYFNMLSGSEGAYWKKFFYPALDKIIEEKKPRLILVTAPPFSVIKLAINVARKHKLPLILCMRDSMTMWVDRPYGSYFHFLATKKLELSYLKFADSVVTVTQQLINDWKSIYGNEVKNNFQLIHNGLDCDIESLYGGKTELQINTTKDKLIIGYVGSFYYHPAVRDLIFSPWWKKRPNRMIQYLPRKEDWKYRSPYYFFRAIQHLLKIKPALRGKISIQFVGYKDFWMDSMINEFGFSDIVKCLGPLSHDKALEFQEGCDLLLSTSVKVMGGEDYCIAGKTYEYFTMKKPILAFVTPGAQREILERSGMAVICDPDHSELSARKIYQLINNRIKLNVNVKFLKQFERKHLTGKLAALIKNIVQDRKG